MLSTAVETAVLSCLELGFACIIYVMFSKFFPHALSVFCKCHLVSQGNSFLLLMHKKLFMLPLMDRSYCLSYVSVTGNIVHRLRRL